MVYAIRKLSARIRHRANGRKAKNKKMTNVRSSGTDEALKLVEPRIMTLEQALEFINDDELVELTPTDIRIRKKILGELERKRSAR